MCDVSIFRQAFALMTLDILNIAHFTLLLQAGNQSLYLIHTVHVKLLMSKVIMLCSFIAVVSLNELDPSAWLILLTDILT